MKFFFTKLNFHTCVPPLIRLLKKIFTKLNFLSRDSGMNFLIFFCAAIGSFGVFWRHIPVFPMWTLRPRLLASNARLYTTITR